MTINFFQNYFQKTGYSFFEMTKKDLNIVIQNRTISLSINPLPSMQDLWNKKKRENYKVYILRKNKEFLGLISFNLLKDFHYGSHEDVLLEQIEINQFQKPVGDVFYLSWIIVQDIYKRKRIGRILMEFLFHFLKIVNEKKVNDFTFYLFTTPTIFNEFFNIYQWYQEY